MKTRSIFAILFSVFILVSGCKKDGALGGKKTILGTVYFHDGAAAVDNIAPGAMIYITYDSKVSTGVVDETTATDAKGEYNFKGLKKGDYFVTAEYTTSHGFKYTTPGHGVTISDKDKTTLNIRLY